MYSDLRKELLDYYIETDDDKRSMLFAKKCFDILDKKFRDGIKDSIRGKEVTEAMIDEKILTDGTLHWQYNYEVLRPFRDKLIEQELTGLYMQQTTR